VLNAGAGLHVQEDYVKWKGALFFRFVSTLVDADPDIQRFGMCTTRSLREEDSISRVIILLFRTLCAANYCLVNVLAVKHQTIFFSNFTEAIFHFNGYMDHKGMYMPISRQHHAGVMSNPAFPVSTAYNRFHQSERELALFSLQGPENKEYGFAHSGFLVAHTTISIVYLVALCEQLPKVTLCRAGSECGCTRRCSNT
jgi:condensin-2 complex subunit D3